MSDLSIRTEDGLLGEVGVVDSIHLGVEDHKCFTLDVGSPARDEWDANVLRLIYELAAVCGRDNFFDVVGCRVVVLRESEKNNAPIVGVHALVGDGRVIFKEVLGR